MGARWRRAFGVLAAAMLLAACGDTGPRRLVLISLDTLRADHLGLYGYPRETSPSLDRMARAGVIFDRAFAPAPSTLPSHGSLLSGLYPSRHGLTADAHVLPTDVPTLASLLSDADFETAAVVNSIYLSERHGLQRGFGHFVYVRETTDRREPSREITDAGVAWLSQHRDARAFLFLHYYDVHSDYASLPAVEARFVHPYRGPADGSTGQLLDVRAGRLRLGPADVVHLIDLYDAGIRQVDDELARLFALLEGAGLLEGTLLVVTSDHGEEFLEHGGVLHGRTQFDEVLHVPLWMRGPGIPAGLRVERAVSLVDVTPTLLALLGVPAPEDLDGRPLPAVVPGAPAPPDPRALFGEADHGRPWPAETRSVRLGRFKLHRNRRTGEGALYDLEADPGERRDVSADHPDVVLALEQELGRFRERARPAEAAPRPTPEERDLLRGLGYVDE
jgi:arylsulfatase A-like enzyme